jgi:hypothetical protein
MRCSAEESAPKWRQLIDSGDAPRKVSGLIQAMKGESNLFRPYHGSHQLWHLSRGFPPAISWRAFGALQRSTHKIRCGQELANRDSNTETITDINLLLIIRRLSKGNQV